METTSFDTCPRCGATMQKGFSARAASLSFVAPEKFLHFAFVDEDLVRAGFRKIWPAKAEYYQSYFCRACKLYLVDYSVSYNRKEAERMARVIVGG